MMWTSPSWPFAESASTVINMGSSKAAGTVRSSTGLPSEAEWIWCELTQLGESTREMPGEELRASTTAQVSDAPELSEADADLA